MELTISQLLVWNIVAEKETALAEKSSSECFTTHSQIFIRVRDLYGCLLSKDTVSLPDSIGIICKEKFEKRILFIKESKHY